MSEERIIELESRLTYQEQLLGDLNDVVTGQQAEIHRLGELFQSLVARIRSLDDASDSDPGEERPPHY